MGHTEIYTEGLGAGRYRGARGIIYFLASFRVYFVLCSVYYITGWTQ